jgi:transcriptional regulator of acetoin/glycerol metabolism
MSEVQQEPTDTEPSSTEEKASPPPQVLQTADVLLPLRIVEAAHIQRVMLAVNGNKMKAARILGIDRRTLYRRLRHP